MRAAVVAITLMFLSTHRLCAMSPVSEVMDDPGLPSLDAIVDQFADVAFGHEHGPSRHVVQKWQTSPRLVFFANAAQEPASDLPEIKRNAAEIHALTGLSWQLAAASDSATLRMGFLPRAEFSMLPNTGTLDEEQRRFLTESACIAIAADADDQPGRITQAAIVIGTDISAPLRRHCLLEEMVQVMGLPNDACHYRPSLFCEDDHLLQMAAADRILLKTLYDPQLPPGMPLADALPVARAIIGALVASLEDVPQRSLASNQTSGPLQALLH